MPKNLSQKSYLLLLLSISLLFISTIVYAETTEDTASTSTSTAAILPVASTTITEATSTEDISASTTQPEIPIIATPKPEINQTALSDSQQQRITNLCANISNRLDALIARHEDIARRLNSRLIKMKEAGSDTASAEAKLQEAILALDRAKTTMKNIDSLVHETVTSPTPKTAWLTVRETYLKTEIIVNQTQIELRAVVQLLKNPISVPSEIEETSTTTDNDPDQN